MEPMSDSKAQAVPIQLDNGGKVQVSWMGGKKLLFFSAVSPYTGDQRGFFPPIKLLDLSGWLLPLTGLQPGAL